MGCTVSHGLTVSPAHTRTAPLFASSAQGAPVGARHDDTRFFHCSGWKASMAPKGKPPMRMLRVRMYHSGDGINALQVEYQIRSGRGVKSATVGGGTCPPVVLERLDLDTRRSETVVAVRGFYSNVIHSLTLETNLGRSVTAGRGGRGTPFELPVREGHQVVGFHGGYGGHLHSLGLYTRPMFGRVKEAWEATKARKLQQGQCGGGGGGDASGHASSGSAGSVEAGGTDINNNSGPPRLPAEAAGWHDTGIAGRSHGDTKPLLLVPPEGMDRPVLVRIDLWSDAFVHAVRFAYAPAADRSDVRETPVVGGATRGCDTATLALEPDEHVVAVSGGCGDIVDRLCFRTSTGRTVMAGGLGGSPFELFIPEGHRVVALHGGYGGHLHRVGAYTAAVA